MVALVGLTSALSASSDYNAEALFDAKCGICHSKTMPKDMNSMIAPALSGVMKHIKMAYPNKEDAVEFMVDYIQYPSKNKAICQQSKIAQFGLMPSVKGVASEDELEAIAEWMFDNFPAKGFVGRGMQNQRGGMTKNTMMQRGMKNRPAFEDFDANGDEMISRDEFNQFRMNRMKSRMGAMQNQRGGMANNAMKQRGMQNRPNFTMFDLNGDGVVTKNELTQFRAQRKAKMAAKGMPMRNAAYSPAFESMDIDGDGQLTQEEFNQFRMNRYNTK